MTRETPIAEASTDAPVPAGPTDTTPCFHLYGGLGQLAAEGCRRHLPSGPVHTLGRRVSAFFAAPTDQATPLIGVLPFDPSGDDALYQPQRLLQAATPIAQHPATTPLHAISQAEPDIETWRKLVSRCRSQLEPRGGNPAKLQKVVLARRLRVTTTEAVDLQSLVRQLASDPSVTTYLTPLPNSDSETPRWLIGATPELLISRRGTAVVSNPLAGSAPRANDSATDNANAQALLASHKDQDEHRYVVEAILDTLTPLCRELNAPAQPSLQATDSLWHLGTRITGRLKHANISVADLVAKLHPTPAVCGTPRHAALKAIQTLEPAGRGFYAGAVGWVNAAGDGDWHVAIRCAQVHGRQLHLYAGAGILADSEPTLEVAETHAKFKAMLDALGITDADQTAAGETSNGCN